MIMKRARLLLALFAVIAQPPVAAQPVHAPQLGSAERTRILDALRPAPDSEIRFIVHELKVIEGRTARYAYAVVAPSKQEYDGGEYLLKFAGHWQVIWSVTGGGTDDCRNAADYYRPALRLLETEGIDADAVALQLREAFLGLAAADADDPDCTAVGDLGPELPDPAPDDLPPPTPHGRPRLVADPKYSAPITEGDLDGDSRPDKISIVHILPGGAGRIIDKGITIANPWDTNLSAQALPDEDTQMALLIETSGTGARYLLHSPYIELSARLKAGAPVVVKRAGSALARAFRKDCPALHRDFLLMATEAGIDIALFWSVDHFEVCWPEEIP
jgi:hypothetical protein